MKKKRLFCIVLFFVSFLLLSLRAPFGYSFNDEPFITSLAQRLNFGDSLFIDEWHVTQNFGVILLPLYKLYTAIFKSTEGILLFFRLTYCLMWCTTCTVVYHVLCKKYKYCIIPYLYLLLFSPLDQMTLSYTSVGLSSALILACLFFYHFEVKNINLYFFSAIFSVFSVLVVICLPFMAIIYLLFVVLVLVFRKFKPCQNTVFLSKTVLFSVCFSAVALVLYLLTFILNGNSFSDFMLNLPKALFDSSHSVSGASNKIFTYIYCILAFYKFHVVLVGVSVILALVPIVRRSFKIKTVIFLINIFAFIAQMIYIAHDPSLFLLNYQMVPIAFLGIVAAFLLDDYKRHTTLFFSFIVWGIIYSLMFHFASDTKLMAISMGLAISGVAGIIYIVLYAKECVAHISNNITKISPVTVKKIFALLTTIVFIVQISACVYIKINRHYLDTAPVKMNSVITCGASKGLITTEKTKQKYENTFSAITQLLENINTSEKTQIRFLNLISDPVIYLNANMPFGTFSSWTFGETKEKLINKYNEYYEMHPKNVPNMIFGDKNSENMLLNLNFDTTSFTVFYEGDYFLLVSDELVLN